MDIFTTVLTKVRPTPIKPEQLRVKALRKEPSTNELTDDINHLEDHDLYFIDGNSQNKEQHKQQNKEHSRHEHSADQKQGNAIEALEPAITDKEEFIHPKDKKNKSEDDIQHLDIFV